MVAVLVGYGTHQVELSDLPNHATWNRLDPEFARRLLALLTAADGRVGIGTGYRSDASQAVVFLQRTIEDPTGPLTYNGKRYRLRPGMAPIAPPGRSFHTLEDGALAADLTGDVQWALAHEAEFGLDGDINGEDWHFQPNDIPRAFGTWVIAGRPRPSRFALPADPPPPIDPIQEDEDMNAKIIAVDGDLKRAEALLTIGTDGTVKLRGFNSAAQRDALIRCGVARVPLTAEQYDALLALVA